MNRIILSSIVFAALCILSFSSCDRTEMEVAGKGGSTTLKVTPQHHGDNIDSCTVFLKYNAKDLPASGTSYDEEVICVQEGGKPVATFTNLKKGEYYVYGQGWDPDINQAVVGGIPYVIEEDGVLNINIPVTEGDH